MLLTITLSSLTLCFVLNLFMSKNTNNSPELSAYEDQEQMLTLSGKLSQSRTVAERAGS